MAHTPIRIEPFNQWEILFTWNTGESMHVPYRELRFECPCASCVDEHTGLRVVQRDQISPGVKPLSANVVGKYALQINWSDGHSTGMYHFDRLFEICQKSGRPLPQTNASS